MSNNPDRRASISNECTAVFSGLDVSLFALRVISGVYVEIEKITKHFVDVADNQYSGIRLLNLSQ